MYYNGDKLLRMKDINREDPEIYISDGNRTSGKTTYFNRYLVNRFLMHDEKFMLLYRYNYELDNVDEQFFTEIKGLFFPHHEMSSESFMNGMFRKLFLDGKLCGFGVAVNNSDQLKKRSHIFNEVSWMLFDEFQSESGRYLPNEVEKLISIHTSVARGCCKLVRRVPLIMVSNHVSILNPYYTELDISQRIMGDTKYLRGVGFVCEFVFNKQASEAQRASAFNRAFGKNRYVSYSADNYYLNDTNTFIKKYGGKKRYIGTFIYKGSCFGLYELMDDGILYMSSSYDTSFPLKVSVTTSDHDVNTLSLTANKVFISKLRAMFDNGMFRFENARAKECAIIALRVK